MKLSLHVAIFCLFEVAALGNVVVQGNIKGGEITKGKWKPDFSFLKPFAKKAEDALPVESKEKAKKLVYLLEHIQTPGCTWDLLPRRSKLKLRKVMHPLGLTDLVLGLDFDPLLGDWSLFSNWRDRVIGGDINVEGTEIAMSKDFQVDDRNKVALRAAFDWQKRRTTFGFKIRPVSASVHADSVSGGRGFHVVRSLGKEHVKVEFDALVELPEVSFGNSQEQGKAKLGFSDVHVDLQELNLLVFL